MERADIINTSDPAFDDAYHISTPNKDFAAAYLQSAGRRELIDNLFLIDENIREIEFKPDWISVMISPCKMDIGAVDKPLVENVLNIAAGLARDLPY